jgi:hypothetical protein
MPQLPQFQSSDQNFQLMQNRWGSILNPIVTRSQNQSIILKKIQLFAASNPNIINHLLQQPLQGWKIVRQRAAASIYDSQDTNSSPQLTLYLQTSADVLIDLEVF